MRVLYTLLYIHLLPVIVLRLFWRGIKAPAYRFRIRERFGWVPPREDDSKLIWIHAVSVGETIAATPMIRRLMSMYPGYRFCITTTTPTGSDRVISAFGEDILHYYLPWDLPSFYTLFFKALRPCCLIIMETELWPNLVATCHHKNIPVILANGRMSKQSARRYKRFEWLTAPMLKQITVIAAQTRLDVERFVFLGARRESVVETGSIKYDVYINEEIKKRRDEIRQQLGFGDRKVVVYASTHPGEDEVILPMIKRLHYVDDNFLAIIVPRHPERFPVVYRLAETHKINAIRLSSGEACLADTQLVIADTMGDMLAIYGLADVAFVGGSLIEHGGHNVLEAAAWSVPTFTGPSTHNFRTIVKTLLKSQGLVEVHDYLDLERLIQNWLKGQLNLGQFGLNANKVLQENRGTLDRLLEQVASVIEQED